MNYRILALSLGLSACAVGPQYQAPDIGKVVPPQWHAAAPTSTVAEQWWQQFHDPILDALLRDAEQNNPDLAQALARIEQARALARAAGATLLPSVSVAESASRSRTQTPGIAEIVFATSWSTALDASWELDLFGKLRQTKTGALARAQASAADWQAARVTLLAEVANNYIGLRACEQTLQLDEQSRQSQQTTLDLTQKKNSAGFVADSDVLQQQAALASLIDTLELQRGTCATTVNELSLLTGRDGHELDTLLAPGYGKLPSPTHAAVLSLPAQVVAQRPDVRSSERNLAAANADIDVATANRYPDLSLSGTIAITSTIGASITNWSLGPTLALPLFTGGRTQAGIDQAQAAYALQLASYRSTVNGAVKEVEDALVRLDSAARRRTAAAQAATLYQHVQQMVDDRYQVGSASVLELEDARRNWLGARRNQISLDQEWSQAWIALYKATGGAWDATHPFNPADATHPFNSADATHTSNPVDAAPTPKPAS